MTVEKKPESDINAADQTVYDEVGNYVDFRSVHLTTNESAKSQNLSMFIDEGEPDLTEEKIRFEPVLLTPSGQTSVDPTQQTQLRAARVDIFDLPARKHTLLNPYGPPRTGNMDRPVLQILIVALLTDNKFNTLYLFPQTKDSFIGIEQRRSRIQLEYEKREQPALKHTGWVNITILTQIMEKETRDMFSSLPIETEVKYALTLITYVDVARTRDGHTIAKILFNPRQSYSPTRRKLHSMPKITVTSVVARAAYINMNWEQFSNMMSSKEYRNPEELRLTLSMPESSLPIDQLVKTAFHSHERTQAFSPDTTREASKWVRISLTKEWIMRDYERDVPNVMITEDGCWQLKEDTEIHLSDIKYVYIDKGSRPVLKNKTWINRIRDNAHVAPFDSIEAPRWDTYQLNEEEVPQNGQWNELIQEITQTHALDFKTKVEQDKVYEKIGRKQERSTRLWTDLQQKLGNPYSQIIRIEESNDQEQGELRGSHAKVSPQKMTDTYLSEFNKLAEEKAQKRTNATTESRLQYEIDETSAPVGGYPRILR